MRNRAADRRRVFLLASARRAPSALLTVLDHQPPTVIVPNLCSFTSDTPALTINGLLPIGGLTVGTLVWAWDEATQTTGWYTVTATWEHADPVLVDLMIDGEPLTTTPEHPFFTRERSWVAAGDLRLGDAIRSADGSWGVVERVVVRKQTQVMYNLTVEYNDKSQKHGTNCWCKDLQD